LWLTSKKTSYGVEKIIGLFNKFVGFALRGPPYIAMRDNLFEWIKTFSYTKASFRASPH
jgi:hypothetical protein